MFAYSAPATSKFLRIAQAATLVKGAALEHAEADKPFGIRLNLGTGWTSGPHRFQPRISPLYPSRRYLSPITLAMLCQRMSF